MPTMTGGGLRRVLVLLVLLSVAGAAAAELALPALTGRVVDGAGLLDAATRARIETKLKDYESKTSDQVVVATVKSLQGTTVEDFANRLFRAWGLGSRKNDNGVLLLVAPAERKVRIEVGYGLEGALTDALSKVIITTAIAPRFKANDYGGGIEAGLDAILSILAGDADAWHRRAEIRNDEADPAQVLAMIVVFLVIIVVFWRMNGGRRGRRGGLVVLPGPYSGGWSGGVSGGYGGGSGGFSDSGFTGGGGSSGGGGASGDW